MERILFLIGNTKPDETRVKEILTSIMDDPVIFRKRRNPQMDIRLARVFAVDLESGGINNHETTRFHCFGQDGLR